MTNLNREIASEKSLEFWNFVLYKWKTPGEFDLMQDSQSTKYDERPRRMVKPISRELCMHSKLSGLQILYYSHSIISFLAWYYFIHHNLLVAVIVFLSTSTKLLWLYQEVTCETEVLTIVFHLFSYKSILGDEFRESYRSRTIASPRYLILQIIPPMIFSFRHFCSTIITAPGIVKV